MNITTSGQRHLGAALGTRVFVEGFVSQKVQEWVYEVKQLSTIALTQPHAAYAAFVKGLQRKWIYLSRTVPDISDFLQPLEIAIRQQLLPAITGRDPPGDIERQLFTLPARLGGLGISDPCAESSDEFVASVQLTSPLCASILHPISEEHESLTKRQLHARKCQRLQERANTLLPDLPHNLQLAVTLACEKGSSTWLTAFPLESHSFSLHKSGFRDALC